MILLPFVAVLMGPQTLAQASPPAVAASVAPLTAASSPALPSGAPAMPGATPTPSVPQPGPAGTGAADTAPILYNYRFVPYPPKDPNAPRVFAVYMNDKVLHAPGPIDIRVDTSPNVVRVEEHTGKNSYVIPMVAPGRFLSNSQLPKVPFIAHGVEVKLDFVAIDGAGAKTDVVVPFRIK